MEPSEYPVVFSHINDTSSECHIYLEMVPEEVVLSPGHAIEILAKPTSDLPPITVKHVEDGLQIYACREFDPDWHVRFNGKVIKQVTRPALEITNKP